jgi:aspartate/methionine/tyrosine aminotransferase
MSPSVTEAVRSLGTEGAFAVLARARALEEAGHDVIHLEIGEPDFETPPHVAEAGIAAIRAGETHYCQTAGLPVLREAAAASLSWSRDVAIDPSRVLVANGAKPFLFFTILATCGPGDEVVYPDPGFPIYESAVRFAGATPVPLPLREERGFSFDPLELEALVGDRTRLVILNAPQNPTGGLIPAADLESAAAAIEPTPAWVLSDEVYSRITYGGDETSSIASLPGMLERTVLLDGFSKTFSMTGWRLGYAALPEALVEPLTRLIVNSTSCVPPFVQLAGVAALEGPQDAVTNMVSEFRARRDYLVPALNAIPGIRCIEPGGAFYAFPNVADLPISADTLADRLLDEAGVAVLAGSAFGRHAIDHLRISYASSLENLGRAVERIGAFVTALPDGGSPPVV